MIRDLQMQPIFLNDEGWLSLNPISVRSLQARRAVLSKYRVIQNPLCRLMLANRNSIKLTSVIESLLTVGKKSCTVSPLVSGVYPTSKWQLNYRERGLGSATNNTWIKQV